MHIGIQLTAPEGYRQLLQGETYSFFKNDTKNGRVFLVHFGGASMAKPVATLFSVPVGDFENGLQNGHIALSKEQSHLPPWLNMLEGINPSHLDALRSHAKKLTIPESTTASYSSPKQSGIQAKSSQQRIQLRRSTATHAPARHPRTSRDFASGI